MKWAPDELRGGASNPYDEHQYGISPEQAKRIADEIMADDTAPSTTPLPKAAVGGPSQGYGKWGDLA
jgi:hypothetical protein